MASYESETFEARAKSSDSSWSVSSAKNPDPVDPQQFDFLDPDQFEKKKYFAVKTQIWTVEKRQIIKNFLISEWFIKFSMRNEGKKKMIWKFFYHHKNQ